MRLKLYCNRYGHFKDALGLLGQLRLPHALCNDFALFYDEHRADVHALVSDLPPARRGQARNDAPRAGTDSALVQIHPVASPRRCASLHTPPGFKRDGRILFTSGSTRNPAPQPLDSYAYMLRRVRPEGERHDLLSHEMELRYQLVPRKRIEKAKPVAEAAAERAEARRTRRTSAAAFSFPAPLPAAEHSEREAPAPRRARARAGR